MYKPGASGNPGGRPKGALNKNKAITNIFLGYIINGGYDKFVTELSKLEGELYVNIMIKLMEILFRGHSPIHSLSVDELHKFENYIISNDLVCKMIKQKNYGTNNKREGKQQGDI